MNEALEILGMRIMDCSESGKPTNGKTGIIEEVRPFRFNGIEDGAYECRVKWDDGNESWIESFDLEQADE